MSYLSRRSREIREEDAVRKHPVYDFRSDRFRVPGRTDLWIPAEDSQYDSLLSVWTWESINLMGRAG